uniref:Knottins-like domain-containing protein n=1 Tax=Aegilops tauschii subsp. strangulata TaxID=200361 RepID=A0A453DKR8_AEGTS
MGRVKVSTLMFLLLHIPVLLVPGSHTKICRVYSVSYTTPLCKPRQCVEACHKEGFPQGWCYILGTKYIIILCVCEKQC